jgi:hypothetical protein
LFVVLLFIIHQQALLVLLLSRPLIDATAIRGSGSVRPSPEAILNLITFSKTRSLGVTVLSA